jgi:hypothetical protein
MEVRPIAEPGEGAADPLVQKVLAAAPKRVGSHPVRGLKNGFAPVTRLDGETMRYLCMVCYDQKTLDNLSKPEFDALVGESLAYDDELRDGGHYLYSGALQSIQTATTLRIQSGKVLATDGPFAETKEHIGGFIVIEARDLDEAIRLASKIPPARLGCIEVRPIQELEPRRDQPGLDDH